MDPSLVLVHRPFAGISGMHRPAAEDSEWSKAINASFDFDEAGFLRLLRRISATVDEREAPVQVQRLSATTSNVSELNILIIRGKT
jgi:hypothetical protein